MAIELKIPGVVISEDIAAPADYHTEYTDILGAKVLMATDVRISRSAGTTVTSSANPDDLLKLTWQGGIVEIIRVDSLGEHLPETVRSAGEGLVVPTRKTIHTAWRGSRSVTLETVKHIRLDKAIEKAKDTIIEGIADAAASWIVPPIMTQIETRRIPNPGLYHLTETGQVDLTRPAENLTSTVETPYLVLIHGTFSDTQGSFSELFASTDEWARLSRAYAPDRIVALEHHTVTENPASNALQIAMAFQGGAHIHILSHSRGGLVGDLICRHPFENRALEQFFSNPQYKYQKTAEVENGAATKSVLEALVALNERLTDQPLQVDRFVRVAAPVAGTLLASDRLNSYLNVILSVLGHVPLPGANLLGYVEAIASAIISTGLDAKQLPGLEAMRPQAQQGFVPFLNCAEPRGDDLAVIAGNVSGGSFFDRIKDFFSTLYFLEPNDFVVDSASMFRGVPREQAIGFYTQAPKANHFSYFSQPETRTLMVNVLADNNPQNFQQLTAAVPYGGLAQTTKRSIPTTPEQPDGNKPVVFLLPGIMGTNLARGPKQDKRRIWVNLRQLAWNGLDDIAFDIDDVEPDGLYEKAYKPLYTYLNEHYHVIPFGFDWRSPVEQAAQALGDKIAEVLDQLDEISRANTEAGRPKRNHPVRIIAHSMGGLVARTFIANNPTTWQRLKQQGGRLIMMGTPNFGSYVPVQVFTQQNPLIRQFSWAAVRHTLKDLTDVVRQYPGLIEMLPVEAQKSLFQHSSWAELERYAPKPQTLAEAKAFREKLDKTAIDPGAMVYIAGRSKDTPAAFKVVNQEATFLYTARGDGTVPWDLGLLKDVSTYYVDASHGEIPSHKPSFEGFLELLNTGVTNKLSATAPITKRSQAEDLYELPTVRGEEPLRYYPNESDLVSAFVGQWRDTAISKPPISLSVINGDIRDARWPVLVGHYQGDPVVSVEAILNQQYDGKLARDLRLGRYPRAIGTVRMYLNEDKNKPGVLVTGLGEPGHLSRQALEAALHAALMEYAITHIAKEQEATKVLSIASLLVGAYGGGRITIEDTVLALGSAAQAVNQDLSAQDLIGRVRIGAIEIYELYRDIAIAAAHATRRLQAQWPKRFVVAPSVNHRSTARRNRPYSPYGAGWNRRIRIHIEGNCIDYEFTTDLARNEPLSQAVQWNLVDLLLDNSTSASAETLSTLFTYLLPYQLKEKITNLPDIVLDLNPEAAKIPWELLDVSTRTTSNREPISVQGSMLRTLSTITPRENPRRSSERRALVIGEPAGVTPPLPAALAEAKAVAALLDKRQLEVTTVFQGTPREIMNALYAGDYDVVHVAAHGAFHGPQENKPSGVVLANDLYLRSNEFANLQAVPSIVFLNCCHLGTIDTSPVGQPSSHRLRQPGKFSASLAEHLVEMGVGVVVVAGWAVSDEPARVFSEKLYSELLNGDNLSNALRAARRATYQACPSGDVTWGAFQVYGDPGFVLHWAGRHSSGRESIFPTFVSPTEFAEYILDMGTKGRVGERQQQLCKELRSLERTLPSEWADSGEIWDAFGESYLQLGAYENAIESYQKAVKRSDAKIRTIEQLASTQSRVGGKLIQKALRLDSTDFTQAQDVLSDAIGRLELLVSIDASAERHSVLGATYKRYALTLSSNDQQESDQQENDQQESNQQKSENRETWFNKAKIEYEKAIELDPPDLYYPLGNKISLVLLVAAADAKLLTILDSDLKAMAKNLEPETDSWARFSKVDVKLYRFLASEDGGAGAIAQEYDQTLDANTSTSINERDSVLSQIRLFADYAKSAKIREAAQQILQALKAINPKWAER